ncbi:MAG: acyltransferase [Verrucomicrobia bacterium]|nr:acyltransferase [Verrucomicrobiota bacterium]
MSTAEATEMEPLTNQPESDPPAGGGVPVQQIPAASSVPGASAVTRASKPPLTSDAGTNGTIGKRDHFDSIDMLRGLAALAVCFYHVVTRFLSDGNPLRWVGSYGYLGVECFFVISGFIIPYTLWRRDYGWSDAGRFMLARVLRLHPAFLGSLLLVLLTLWLPTVMPPPWHLENAIDWGNVALHLIYLPEWCGRPWLLGVYWSLAIEMQYYLLVALVYPWVSRGGNRAALAFAAVFAASAFLTPKASVGHHACMFLPGMLMFWWKTGRIRGWQLGVCLAVMAVLLRCHDGGFRGVAAVGLAVWGIGWWRWRHPAGAWLGRISYSFYLIHTIVAFAFLGWLTPLIGNEWGRTGLVLVAVALALGAAALFYRWLEEPSHRWARRCFRKRV